MPLTSDNKITLKTDSENKQFYNIIIDNFLGSLNTSYSGRNIYLPDNFFQGEELEIQLKQKQIKNINIKSNLSGFFKIKRFLNIYNSTFGWYSTPESPIEWVKSNQYSIEIVLKIDNVENHLSGKQFIHSDVFRFLSGNFQKLIIIPEIYFQLPNNNISMIQPLTAFPGKDWGQTIEQNIENHDLHLSIDLLIEYMD